MTNINLKFATGQIVATIGIQELIKKYNKFKDFITSSLYRHCNGDWGDLGKEDKELNEQALKSGEDRLFSKYIFNGDISIYIITEWDRSATTILLPEEY